MSGFGMRSIAGLTLLVALVATGCVMPDQVSRLQKDVGDIQQQLDQIARDQKAARGEMDQLALAMSEVEPPEAQVTRAEFADIEMQLDGIERYESILTERLGETNRRIDGLSQDLLENREIMRQMALAGTGEALQTGQEGTTPVARIPRRPSVVPSAEALYNAAYTDFSKGNYALAISGFDEYATRYGDSDQADNAMYWIGECYFSQGSHTVAIGAFDRMLERYPDSDRAPAANLKKGLAYLEQNQIREAIVQLEFVQNEYPGTDEARIATDKLFRLAQG